MFSYTYRLLSLLVMQVSEFGTWNTAFHGAEVTNLKELRWGKTSIELYVQIRRMVGLSS